MIDKFLRCLVLVAVCCTLVPPSFASDGKSMHSLQLQQRPHRNEKPVRVHPHLKERLRSVRVIGIAPPFVKAVHYINNIPEERADWAQAAARGALKQIKRKLDYFLIQHKVLGMQGPTAEELEDVYALYAAIVYSIDTHTRKGKDFFYDKFSTFDYSVGPIDAILDKSHADALLLTTVYGVINSKSLHASAKGCVTTAALVDRSGTLLWYGESNVGYYDIRSEWDAADAMRDGLLGFPSLNN
jgi:hypothetical protein